MKYQVFICDDNPDTIGQLKHMLLIAAFRLSDNDSVTFNVFGQATTYKSAINILQKTMPTGGIYFLDVELGKNIGKDNGFDLAEYIKHQKLRLFSLQVMLTFPSSLTKDDWGLSII